MQVEFVDSSATGNGTGTDWNNAYPFLDVALSTAPLGTTLLIAEGVYLPAASTGDTARDNTFLISNGHVLRGGFLGNAGGTGASTNPMNPDGKARNTLLSGDIAQTPTDSSDDVYHVVTIDEMEVGPPVGLWGVRISFGFADGSGLNQSDGGGIFSIGSNVVVADCLVTDNFASLDGGGINATGLGRMDVKRTLFQANTCGGDGAGVRASDRTWLTLFNDKFRLNTAVGSGGGIRFTSTAMGTFSQFKLANSLLFDNSAATGAGVSLDGASSGREIVNCTIAFNTTPVTGVAGAGIFVTSSTQGIDLVNSIVVFNPDMLGAGGTGTDNVWTATPANFFVHHSNVGNVSPAVVLPATNRLNTDPLFVNSLARNLRLKVLSPCLEAGDDSRLPSDILDVDDDGDLGEILDKDYRIWGFGGVASPRQQVTASPVTTFGVDTGPTGIVDMGAFEHIYLDPLPPQ